MVDGIKRNSTIYVGDSIVRKTDSTLNKDEDIVVCLTGMIIEHVTERVQRIMGRGNGGTLLVQNGTNNACRQRRNNSDSEEIHESTEEDEGSEGSIDDLIRDFTSVWNQEPRIQKFEEDGSQRYCEAALQGRGSGIRGFMGQLCGERRNVRERWRKII